MKKIKILSVFLFIAFSLPGCREEKKSQSINTINIDNDKITNNSLLFSNLYEIEKCLPLETKDSSLIGSVDKIITTDNHIIILDNSQKSVLVFDKENGKFKSKIYALGKGPEEYTEITDVDYDFTRNTIIIYEKYSPKILRFDLNGHYIGNSQFEIKNSGLNLITTNNYTYFHRSFLYNDITNKGQLSVFENTDDNNLKFKKSFYDLPENLRDLYTNSILNWFKKDNKLYYNPILSDTIYEIQGTDKKPFITLNFSDELEAERDLIWNNKVKFKDGEDYVNYKFNNKHFIPSLYKIIVLDDYVYIQFVYKSILNTIFHSLKTGENVIYRSITPSNNEKLGLNLTSNSQQKNSLIGSVWAIDAIPYFEKYNLVEGKTIKDEDNPVIVFYKIKEF